MEIVTNPQHLGHINLYKKYYGDRYSIAQLMLQYGYGPDVQQEPIRVRHPKTGRLQKLLTYVEFEDNSVIYILNGEPIATANRLGGKLDHFRRPFFGDCRYPFNEKQWERGIETISLMSRGEE